MRATTTTINPDTFMQDLKESMDIVRKNGVGPCEKVCMVSPATWEKLGSPDRIGGVKVEVVDMMSDGSAIVRERRSKLI